MKWWVKVGLGWGIWMFIANTFIWPLIIGEEITLKTSIVKFIYWILIGLFFGYFIEKYKIAKAKFKK